MVDVRRYTSDGLADWLEDSDWARLQDDPVATDFLKEAARRLRNNRRNLTRAIVITMSATAAAFTIGIGLAFWVSLQL